MKNFFKKSNPANLFPSKIAPDALLDRSKSKSPHASPQGAKEVLQSTEWILVLGLLAILASMVLVSKINAARACQCIEVQNFESHSPLEVKIQGAVVKPGNYQVFPGTSLDQVLRKARPRPSADLTAFDLKQRVREPMELTIEELKEITVTITGAVYEPGEVRLPLKTRICDLKSKVLFTDEADLEFFKKRRQLKNRENIEVPKKTIE